jgi:phosphate:Na+ symporter
MDTIVLLDLMGGVALLLWGLHMVRSGILRAFGSTSFAAWLKSRGRLRCFSAMFPLCARILEIATLGQGPPR